MPNELRKLLTLCRIVNLFSTPFAPVHLGGFCPPSYRTELRIHAGFKGQMRWRRQELFNQKLNGNELGKTRPLYLNAEMHLGDKIANP